MKQYLLAAAAAVCLNSSAQSSVTLFGVLDAGMGIGKGSIANMQQLQSGGYNTSRLGFRGTEDIGDGLRTNYWIEAQIAVDTGIGTTSNSNNQGNGVVAGAQGLFFNRRSTVSLSSSSWGEVRLGRDYTPLFMAQSTYDPFGVTGIGATQSLMGSVAATAPHSRDGATNGIAARASNSISYLTPTMASGVYGSAMTYYGENVSGIATSADGNGVSARLGWSNASADVSLGYMNAKFAVGNLTSKSIGGFYRFDNGLKLSTTINRDDIASALPSGRGRLAGVSYPLGVAQLQASYSSYRLNDVKSSGANKLALGYIHNLSSRTALYFITAQIRNQGTSTQSLSGAVTAAGTNSTGYSLGIRHSF